LVKYALRLTLVFWCWPGAKGPGAAIAWMSSLGLSRIEMDGFDLPLVEIGHVFGRNL
jgi:hypothetical protein